MEGLTISTAAAEGEERDPGSAAVAYLDGVLSVTDLVRRQTGRRELVQAVADSIMSRLGWQTVIVNFSRPERGDLVVAACAGSEEARRALLGTSSRIEVWQELLASAEQVAGAYLVAAGRIDWAIRAQPTWAPRHPARPASEGWAPDDALFVPLRDGEGRMIGVISVDEPLSGLRPSSTDCAVLAAFCAHLATALEISSLSDVQRRRSIALDRIVALSELARGSTAPEPVLDEIVRVAARCLALSEVEAVLIAGGRLRLAGRAGAPATWFEDRTPAELEAALAGTEHRDGVEVLTSGPGPQTLACALTDLEGRTIGAITAVAPELFGEDLPSRLRLLRTFADVAQRAISSSAQEALRLSEARKDAILTSSLDAILSVDGDSHIVEFNPAAERTFGHRREDVLGRDMAELIIPERLREQHRAGLARSFSGQPGVGFVDARVEITAMRADGSEFPAELAVVRVDSAGPAAFTAFLRDITERRGARAELERERDDAHHAATHDALTGLLNRRGLSEACTAAARPLLTGFTVGLGGLSAVAEGFGQPICDDLIRAVARRLAEIIDGHGAIARVEQSAFAVVAAEASVDGLARAVEAMLSTAFELDGVLIQPQFAIGLASTANADVEEWLRRTSVARSGVNHPGGRVASPTRRYDSALDLTRERLRLASDLRRGIVAGELELHYQPLVNPRSGELRGLEALVRWRRGGGELVPPLRFISLAEATGLIAPLGEWVAGEACRQVAAWRAAGLRVPVVGINVSPHQVPHHDVAALLSREIARHGLAPSDLCVEVTETALQVNVEQMERMLIDLADLGVRCALDDFGAEYASLTRLSSLPFEMIKVDRGFLAKVPADQRATAFLRAIVDLGRSLDLLVTIEGIETTDQLGLISRLEVTLAQGFLFSRPRPASETVALLRATATSAPDGDPMPPTRGGGPTARP